MTDATHESGWIHGPTVIDGEVQYLSVSSAQKAMLCMRRWYYHYVMGLKDGDTDATDRGKRLHSQVAHFLITGDRSQLSSQVLAGLHMVEPPGSDLLVEHDVLLRLGPKPEHTRAASAQLLIEAPLRAAGIPFTGAIDLMHARGTNRGTPNVEEMFDPPGTVEVYDHKFPGRMDRALQGRELINTIQMSGYAMYVFKVLPDAKLVRISHGYMPVKGTPRKATALVDYDQVSKAWESTERLAGSIRDVARETNPDNIDADTRACRAYGRDCPARSICKAGMHNSLASIFGPTAAQGLLAGAGEMSNQPPIAPNSLTARLLARQANPPGAASGSATGGLGALMITGPTAPPLDMAVAMAELATREAEAKFPGLGDVLDQIAACQLGMITMTGALGAAAATLRPTLKPDGDLAQFSFDDATQLPQVLNDARAIATQRATAVQPAQTQTIRTTTYEAPAMPALVPPDAPVSNPALASKPPEPTPTPAPTTDAAAIATITGAAETPKRGRGRPKKTPPAAVIDTTAVETTTTPTASAEEAADFDLQASSPMPEYAPTTSTINLYVDCIVSGIETTSLWPIVDKLMADLATRAGATIKLPDGRTVPTDVRLADPNGPTGFGRWKGGLTAFLRETQLPPGHYTFDGSFGEVGAVVVEAMREVVRRSGGILVRGAR